ncbi:uncharacterized protein [Aegilops tauschii subsp. strangulata]|uniref:uncharacterized protein isoform X2 n=1 Tax=Aegilops tauschii subsp. strangulata TaxID=200361 RepID=UPI000989AAFE
MAANACCTCGDAIDDEKEDTTFFECVRCARWQHNCCFKNWDSSEDPELCDICLDQQKQQPHHHQWVEKLASLDFRMICEPYRFCYLCSKHFCARCCPAAPPSRRRDHGNHPTFIIEVVQHEGLLIVRLEDVNHFYDCSRVEPEMAFPGWVRLHPKPEEQDAGGGGGGEPCGFRECNRRIAQDYDFCSIHCQFEEIGRDPVMPPTRQAVLDSRAQKYRVKGLLTLEHSNGTPIVSLGHGWDKFCLLCHAGFSSQVCHHHDNHSTIEIIDTPEFGLVARFIQTLHGEWLTSLSTVQSSREERALDDGYGWFYTEVIVEVPLMMQSHPVSELRPNSCRCGSGIDKDMVYCSVQCMAGDL